MVRAFERYVWKDCFAARDKAQLDVGIQAWTPKQRSLSATYCRSYVSRFFSRTLNEGRDWKGNEMMAPLFERCLINIERDIDWVHLGILGTRGGEPVVTLSAALPWGERGDQTTSPGRFTVDGGAATTSGFLSRERTFSRAGAAADAEPGRRIDRVSVFVLYDPSVVFSGPGVYERAGSAQMRLAGSAVLRSESGPRRPGRPRLV